jgi:hypothetical protein
MRFEVLEVTYYWIAFYSSKFDHPIRDISSVINVKVQLEKCISKLHHNICTFGEYISHTFCEQGGFCEPMKLKL